jgi:hypothetical protein
LRLYESVIAFRVLRPDFEHLAELMLPAVDLGGRVWLGGKRVTSFMQVLPGKIEFAKQ